MLTKLRINSVHIRLIKTCMNIYICFCTMIFDMKTYLTEQIRL
ncbi:unnamed protein product [Schistosoma mattheei]|uniref:Uncharacterized protein n=1 Tax=Schistosoma mattheei TaxID=31246 RepID=A0A183P5Q4_9TREM|nr:unnamed protein product [Schistosoma mattheei]